tara:strand:- start:5473 stop:6342 length:870 start_codon:yes stop_codon:yes gene_type:complete
MSNELSSLIQEIFGNTVKVTQSSSIVGGSISNAQVLSLSNGDFAFLKHHYDPPIDFFQKEAHGLNLLRLAQGGPRVPKSLCVSYPNYFLMEYIPQESPEGDYYELFGHTLAQMHRTTADCYGLDHDNYIGKTIQRNARNEDPIAFFRESRIRYQQKLARKRKLIPVTLDCDLDILCDKLENFLDTTNEKPALLHGDLWSGNYFCGPNREPCIFDPAVHYGLREADLAMTELFGGMPRRFYQAYEDAFPLNPGYEERRDLYNLYHLLNHLNLFGSSYLGSIKSVLKHYIG